MSKCYLKKPPFYQCCCVCANHKEIMKNDTTKSSGKYICTYFFGDEDDGFIVESTEHSCGCGCWWDNRRDHTLPSKPTE
jgi:sarcosine oxidase delta subunit